MEHPLNNLFKYFAGEFVSVLLNKDIKQSIQTTHTVKTIVNPCQLEGYLIDEDDIYFFIGSQPGTINTAINKKMIVTMELIDPNQDMAIELDQSVETPKDDKGVN